jgi:hypothetical protein
MTDISQSSVAIRPRERERRLVAVQVQEIECNPLSDEEVAMFEMFEHKAWTAGQRRAQLRGNQNPSAT